MDQAQLDSIVTQNSTFLTDFCSEALVCKGDLPIGINDIIAEFNHIYASLASSYGLQYKPLDHVPDTVIRANTLGKYM